MLHKEVVKLVNKQCPDFSLPDFDRRLYRFKKLKGKVLVITFWLEFRDPCLWVLPFIEKAYQRYATGASGRIVTVTYGDKNKIKKVLKNNNYSFPVLFDRYQETFDKKFSIKTVPATFLVDKRGIVRYIHFGYNRNLGDFILEKIKELKAEKETAD
jgi:peroxiredoxin